MRGDIRQKITLEGGEEVKRQLAQMGKSGEEAIHALDRAVNSANADLGRFTATVAGARAGIATMHASFATAGDRLGVLHGSMRNFGAAMRASAATILPFNMNMVAMAAALTAAVAPLALFAQAKKAALATDELVDVAANLKITTEELVALRQVSEAGGASFDVIEKAMQKGNRTLGEAVAKTKDFQTAVEGEIAALRGSTGALDQSAGAVETLRGGQKALKEEMQGTVRVMRGSGSLAEVANEYAVIARLAGTTIQQLAKMSPIDRLLAEGMAIGKVKDETEQARLANAAWGKTYADMLPALRDAETLLKPTIARVKEFKQGVSAAEKSMSEGFLQALARMNTAMGRISSFVGGTLGIALVPVFLEIERVIVLNRKAIEDFANAAATRVMPVVQDLIALVRGVGPAGLRTDFVKGLVSAFEQLKVAATVAFDVIKTGFLLVSDVLAPVAAGINSLFGTEFSGSTLAAGAAILYLTGAFTLVAAAIGVVVAAIAAVGALPVLITTSLALLAALWWKHRDQVALIFQGLWSKIGDGLDWVGAKFTEVVTSATQTWADFTVWLGQAWQTLAVDPIVKGLNTVIYWINYVIGLAQQALNAIGLLPGSSGGGAVGGAAAGGLIRGPGTGTSDSILARVSNHEYVIRAAAVEHFGVGFFDALNRLRTPQFAFGGLVDALSTSLMPRSRGFRSGGLVTAGAGGRGGTPVHLHLDGRSFALSGKQDVVEALGKHARGRKVRSGGRAPSWVS